MSDLLGIGYAIRRPTAGDAEAVQALIVASDGSEFGEAHGYSLEELRSDWSGVDLDGDAWLAIGPTGEIAGYALVRHRRYLRMDAEVYVHPEHFGQGIGTAFVRLAEARAREWLPLAPEGVRLALRNWINANNAEACALLLREGYAPARYFWRMEAALGGEMPEAVWPDGMSVRSAGPDEDLRLFHETTEAAMADHWGHIPSPFEEWRERRTGFAFDPALWFLAMAGDEAAGVALCAEIEGDGWVDTLGVCPAWRRQGVGTALLRHAFGALRERGVERVLLIVDAQNPTGALGLYERAGMRVTQQYAGYEKELRAGVAVGEEV